MGKNIEQAFYSAMALTWFGVALYSLTATFFPQHIDFFLSKNLSGFYSAIDEGNELYAFIMIPIANFLISFISFIISGLFSYFIEKYLPSVKAIKYLITISIGISYSVFWYVFTYSIHTSFFTEITPITFLIIVSIYYIPSYISEHREHHNKLAITLTNLTLGWTVLGWLVTLIWSTTSTIGSNTNTNK